MIFKDLVIIGGGPAGLSAAKIAAEAGVSCLIIERDPFLGGQLIKQTHMFFGSKKQYAKTRGLDIAKILIDDCLKHQDLIEIMTSTTVVGLYKDKVITTLHDDTYNKIKAKSIIVSTGASERFLAFENNDLPGVYGAGAVQTLMNVYGVKPADKVIMVGSGNIGLIVSYQLHQAGVKVLKVIEAASNIGGYKVHASKIRRIGIPIETRKTIKRAIGKDKVEQVEIVSLDDDWNIVDNSSEIIDVDAVCISVGLIPQRNLLSMIDIKTKFIKELGGIVPIINEDHQTSDKDVYVCGDVSGVEEASSAIVEGYYTGLIAARNLGKEHQDFKILNIDYKNQLLNLRSGPFGKKTLKGLEIMKEDANVK